MPEVGVPLEPLNEDAIEKNLESDNSLRTVSDTLPRYFERGAEDGDKEVVAIEEGKEVVPSDGLHLATFSDEKHVIAPEHEKETFLGFPKQSKPRQKICGIRRRSLFLTVGIIVVCCLILIIALTLNLNKTKK
jgi:hypothetical protein